MAIYDQQLRSTPRLATALDKWQIDTEAKALTTGPELPPLVFPSEAGTPLDDVNVGRRFREVAMRAGLPKLSLYSLRHTYASHLLGTGVPITYVSNQMGHSKPTTALGQLLLSFLREKRAAARASDQLQSSRADL